MHRNAALVLYLLVCASCEYGSFEFNNSLLKEITVDGNTRSRFEYAGGLLIREQSFFDPCDNPVDERTYSRRGGRLVGMELRTWALYSSIASMCDPLRGVRFDEYYEYDSQNRITKVARAATTTEFFYNAIGHVAKQVTVARGDGRTTTSIFDYDANGNLIMEADEIGNVTYYEYDRGQNPFYLMKQRPAWISPFNKSPNNLIKATGAKTFEREFIYVNSSLPSGVVDSNGLTYQFHYD